ncbi:MAG: MoaD/ThiS family protein [Promethearchaeota archaeon]
MNVTIKFYAEARDATGAASINLELKADQCTLPALLTAIDNRTSGTLRGISLQDPGQEGKPHLTRGYTILLNEVILSAAESKKAIIHNGDIVGILPPFSGG